MTTPAVSIVVPTYNHAQFLSGALRSIIEQSFQDWEAVIVNNFSTDETLQVISAFDEPRFRVINFRNNGVIAASRNEGIRCSSGGLIAFLDSDDIWYKNKLARCVAEFEKGGDVVCHGEKWMSNSARPRNVIYGPASNATHENLLFGGNCLSTSATVIRKKILDTVGGFSEDPTFTTAEDYELWLRISQETSRFVFMTDILGEYRRHELGASSSVERHLAAELAVVRHHVSLSPLTSFTYLKKRHRESKAIYSAGRTCMRAGGSIMAIGYLFKAILKSPLFFRSYAALCLVMFRKVSKRRR